MKVLGDTCSEATARHSRISAAAAFVCLAGLVDQPLVLGVHEGVHLNQPLVTSIKLARLALHQDGSTRVVEGGRDVHLSLSSLECYRLGESHAEAFGGIIACNTEVDEETALLMKELFVEAT